jgi:hypothetical protein
LAVIEFAGSSCAGKTTLVQHLVQQLQDIGIPHRHLDARRDRLRKDLHRTLRDPRIALWCLINLRIPWKRARTVIRAIGLMRRHRSEPGTLLIDEGPVKLFNMIAYPAPRAQRLLWKGMPKPDVLVIVTCDPITRLKRMRASDRPHIRGLSDREALAKPSGDICARGIARFRGVPVIEIDTSPESPPPDLLTQLWPYLSFPEPPIQDSRSRLSVS